MGGTRQQTLGSETHAAKQQKALRAKNVLQNAVRHDQAVNLDMNHDVSHRHDAGKKIEHRHGGGKQKCSRNYIVGTLLVIFLFPFGAHRWYYGYNLIGLVYLMLNFVLYCVVCVLRLVAIPALSGGEKGKNICTIIYVGISTAISIILGIGMVIAFFWELIAYATQDIKPVDLAKSTFFNWKVEDCEFSN